MPRETSRFDFIQIFVVIFVDGYSQLTLLVNKTRLKEFKKKKTTIACTDLDYILFKFSCIYNSFGQISRNFLLKYQFI